MSSTVEFGAHPAVLWLIKHVVNPIDTIFVRVFRGRLPQPSSLFLPTLLLTVVGHRSGKERTIPLVYVRNDSQYVVANARPAGEGANPWVSNLRAAGRGTIRVRGHTIEVTARELADAELDTWWAELTAIWPAFDSHFAATGERAVFALVGAPKGAGRKA